MLPSFSGAKSVAGAEQNNALYRFPKRERCCVIAPKCALPVIYSSPEEEGVRNDKGPRRISLVMSSTEKLRETHLGVYPSNKRKPSSLGPKQETELEVAGPRNQTSSPFLVKGFFWSLAWLNNICVELYFTTQKLTTRCSGLGDPVVNIIA